MSQPAPVLVAGLVSRTVRVVDRGDLLDHLGEGGFAWLRGGSGLVAAGVAARIPIGPGPSRFEVAAAAAADVLAGIDSDNEVGLPGTGPLAVGALPFAEHRRGELLVPALVVGRGPDGVTWVTETGPVGAAPTPAPRPVSEPPSRFTVEAPRPRAAWLSAVERAIAAIEARELAKVVLARDVFVEADRPFDRRVVLARLRERYPSCFTFAAGDLAGATPELLIERRAAQVVSRPVAGTSPPGAARRLRSSAKELAEHRLVVDGVVAGLAPVCGGLAVPESAEVIELANVAHLATTVTGRLRDPAPTALALAGRLHPTPAVGGTPTQVALRLIAELEGLDRGCYGGAVGWVDARGDGEWAVALRCAELSGDRARLFAGVGIVEGSEPEAEWAETQQKLEAMLGVLVCP